MNKKYTLNYTGKFKKDLKLCKKVDAIFLYSKKSLNSLKQLVPSHSNITRIN